MWDLRSDGDEDRGGDEDRDGGRDGASHIGPQCPVVQVVTTGNQRQPDCRPSTLPGQRWGEAAWGWQPGGSGVAVTWRGAAAAWAHLSAPISPLKRREDYNEVVLFP